MNITHRTIEANGITIRFAEAGEGPLVLMLHGYPESWYSWRHQLTALAEAGYHAVAPDMRGYGGTDAPADPSKYTALHIAGDALAVVDACGATSCVVVGHDWGAPAASLFALLRPDIVRGLAVLSVPYLPRGEVDVLTLVSAMLGPDNYQQYFQTDAAQAALEADPRRSVLSTLLTISGENPDPTIWDHVDPNDVSTLLRAAVDGPLPPWLTEADVDYYVSEFTRTGFLGGLNWYRVSALNWELLAPWNNAPLRQPSLFVAGDKDLVMNWPGMSDIVPMLKELSMPGLTKSVILPGCGHWTQQERPDEVNALLLEFLYAVHHTAVEDR